MIPQTVGQARDTTGLTTGRSRAEQPAALPETVEIFPAVREHVHGSTIVERRSSRTCGTMVPRRNGHWVLAYNDAEEGRHSLAVSLSTDEGKTWSHT